jgi:hypothetical protein
MRNLRKARAARRRKRRSKRRSKRRTRRSKRRSRRHHGGGHIRSNKGHEIMQRLINKGRSPQQAARVAARIERMRAGKARRYFEKEALQAKNAQQLSNAFAGIGMAGHLAHSAGQR